MRMGGHAGAGAALGVQARRRALVTTSLAACSACLACSAETEFVAWPDSRDDRLSFIVTLVEGSLGTVRGPFGDDLGLPPLPRVNELLRDSSALLLLELDPVAIRREVSVLRMDHLAELTLEPHDNGCSTVRYEPGRQRLALRAEHGLAQRLAESEFEPAGLTDLSLALVVPVDEAWCLNRSSPVLAPFGATPKLLEEGTPPQARPAPDPEAASRIKQLEAFGADRVLAASSEFLFVFERGERWSGDLSRYWDASTIPPLYPDGRWDLSGFLADELGPDETMRIVVLLEWKSSRETGPSHLVELTWSSEGFSAPVILHQAAVVLSWLGRLSDGRPAAAGQGGTLLVRSADESGMVEITGTGLERASLRGGAVGPTPSEPLVLIDSRHNLHFGQPRSGYSFRTEESPWTLSGGRSVERIETDDEGVVYVSDTGAPELMLRRGPSGARELWHPAVPDALASCAQPPNACNERLVPGDRPSFAVTGHSTLVMGWRPCSALIEVHPIRRCSRVLELELVEPSQESEARRAFVRGGRLFVGGARGLLLDGEWTD